MKRMFFLYFLLLGSILFTSCASDDPAPPTLSAPTITGIFQPEGAISISFTNTGSFKTGNIFTAQLSDGTGNFSNPTAIGTLSATTAGTIQATLPAGIANGTGYRIRVIASTPATTSPDNGTNLSITAPTITISSVATANAGETFIPGRTLTITTTLTGTFANGNQFKLQLSDASGNFNSATILATITNTVLDASLTGSFLPPTTQAGAGYRYRWVSTNPAINGTPSNPISVVLPTLSTPVVSGNLVAGGDILVSVNATNGPWFNSNQLRVQLSDATGSFANPIDLRIVNTTLLGSQQNQSLTMAIPINVPAGAGYKIRATTASPVVTSNATASFAIGALPTISFAAGTPAFTKIYSGKTYGTAYTLSVSKTGTFNAGTSFTIQMSNNDQTFASGNSTTVATLSTNQVTELQNTGSTIVTMFLRDLGNGTRRFRVNSTGHGGVVSNELQMNVTQCNLNNMSGNIDAQTINFGTNLAAYTTNTPSTRNNQELLLAADEPTTMFGATTVRMFIGMPLVSENVGTGAQSGRIIVHFLNAAGEQIAIFSNPTTAFSVSGSPTAYTLSANGPYTLTRTSGTAGNTTITLQTVSASFKVQ